MIWLALVGDRRWLENDDARVGARARHEPKQENLIMPDELAASQAMIRIHNEECECPDCLGHWESWLEEHANGIPCEQSWYEMRATEPEIIDLEEVPW